MSEIITVINMKGGVGKTTLSVNVSYVLSKFHEKKVLLVDIDPQFNATQYLLNQEIIINHFKNKKTVYDILMPSKEEGISLSSKKKIDDSQPIDIKDYIVNVNEFSNGKLDMIPSSLKLINFETNKRGVENRLKKFLETHCSHYDYIIIDCPPTLSLLTLGAYLASSHYLIPIKPDYLSSLGLPLLERGLNEYNELHSHSLNLLGIVFTMVDKRPNATYNIMQEINDNGWECFVTLSRHSSKVAESVHSLDDFYYYAKYKDYANEFKLITQELIKKIDEL